MSKTKNIYNQLCPIKPHQISITNNELTFTVNSINNISAAKLRAICLSYVPTYAIETVTIRTNTSYIQDEMLAHRLGLIPFITDENSTEHIVHLKVKCEENERTPKFIYASDLLYGSVVDSNVVICQLHPGQEIDCLAVVKEGIGHEHCKWSPVSSVMYKQIIPHNITIKRTPVNERNFTFKIELSGMMDYELFMERAITIYNSLMG